MGLTKDSVALSALDTGLKIQKKKGDERIIAIAGNPNVGKSTIFNALTGMNQHTGNWPGKTVANAQGYFCTERHNYTLVDIPGTYSLLAHSAEEEVARDFLCFGECDATVVVCDATCLERNLNLVLQCKEIGKKMLVCVNLIDEAKRKNIRIDLDALSKELGIPVIAVCAREKACKKIIGEALDLLIDSNERFGGCVEYDCNTEKAISIVLAALSGLDLKSIDPRWAALTLLSSDHILKQKLCMYLSLGSDISAKIDAAVNSALTYLTDKGISKEKAVDLKVSALIKEAERISRICVIKEQGYNKQDLKIDKILTSKRFGYPIMFSLLMLVFWITISGANYPSAFLSDLFFGFEGVLEEVFVYLKIPYWIYGILVLGMYRVLSWVVSVMLPPMAIFFPLFTILEDLGYLPRIAYNLDRPFKCCGACGKQALTMCMGFGCNAAAVTGARIIDSPRERLLAVLTNNFVPCNGRFPALISIITMFFLSGSTGISSSLISAFFLACVILSGIFMTFAVTKLLSKTLLRGETSSYTLELPPYRPPEISKIVVRSVFDRTLFVLGRAVAIAAPAGILIYLMANTTFNGTSVLSHCAQALDPIASLMGLDGVILIAFILGFPANEIVVPIMLMAYLSNSTIVEIGDIGEIKRILCENGWGYLKAVNFIVFSLFHFPCSTTLLTIKKETASMKWTIVAALLPTLIGISFCVLITFVSRIVF